jgi:DNA polymerase III subunit delta'
MSDDTLSLSICEPRATERLIGHDAAQTTLLQAWTSGRFHHAWLLAGPRGIGKATLAWRMARFVLTQPIDVGDGLFGDAPAAPTSLAPDPQHPVLAQILAGSAASVRVLERQINDKGKLQASIDVEQVRALIPFMGSKESGWRVVIVDAADELNRNAANALLKILEEPPARTLFLLIAHAPGRVLATIRSRCRRLDLRGLASSDVHAVLGQAGVPVDMQAPIAALAHGAPGRALRYAAAGAPALQAAIDAAMVGRLADKDRIGLIMALVERDALPRLEVMFELTVDAMAAALTRAGQAGGRADLEPGFELWEKARALAAETLALNLEPKLALGEMLDLAAALARQIDA